MKKILVTGASGSIGLNVIKYLLSEGKYEITALDLKHKKAISNLKRYKKRINVIFGDVTDQILMEGLVKGHDVVIHLAGVMPPMANMSEKINDLVDYKGCENIIKAINFYNEKCFLMYPSTTSIYGDNKSHKTNDKIKEDSLDFYGLSKLKIENLIKKKLKNYTIFRLPLVLNNVKDESFTYNIKKKDIVEVSTKEEVAYAFVKGIEYQSELNKKVYNVGMGEEGRVEFNSILKKLLKYHGMSCRFVFSRVFLDKNFYSPILLDSDKLENIIHYRFDTLEKYYKRLEYKYRNRRFRKLLAKPFIIKKNKNKEG